MSESSSNVPGVEAAGTGLVGGQHGSHARPTRSRRKWVRRLIKAARVGLRLLFAIELIHFVSDRAVKARHSPANRFGRESSEGEDEEEDEEDAVVDLLVGYINGDLEHWCTRFRDGARCGRDRVLYEWNGNKYQFFRVHRLILKP